MLLKLALAARITVVIFHADAVPEREMAHAQALAGEVLRQAGVEVKWRRATPADLLPRPGEIPLHLIEGRPAFADPDACGYAMLMAEGSYAGVSYRAVREAAVTMDTTPSTVLAATILHELGHVLMASKEHAAFGVMAPHLGRRDIEALRRGEFRFTPDQARRIRTGTMPR